jgi:opacity protein-like surface antigen
MKPFQAEIRPHPCGLILAMPQLEASMKRWRLAALTALITVAAVPAQAQGFISPFLGFNFGGDQAANCESLTNCEEKRLDWGVAFGSTSGVLGFEEEIAYSKDFFGKTGTGSNSVLTVMSNVMLIVPAGPIRPYGLIGLGLIRPHNEFNANGLDLSDNALGYDIGGGVNIFLTPNVGIRGDVRHLHTLQDVTLGVLSDEKLDFWRGSAGLTFKF